METRLRRSIEICMALTSMAITVLVSSHSWFLADDLVLIQTARQMDFGWEYLSRDFFGHVLPGHRILSWLIALSSPISWSLVVAMAICFAAITAFGVRRFLRREGVAPLVATLAGCAVVLSGAWLHTAQWYSALGYQFPGAMFGILAACCLQSWNQLGRVRDIVGWALMIGVGLMFDERISIFAFFLLALLWLLGHRRKARLVGSAVVACAIIAPWFLWSVSRDAISMSGESIGVVRGTSYLLQMFFANFLPTVLGWTVELEPFGMGPVVIALLTTSVLAFVLIASSRRSRTGVALVLWGMGLVCVAIVPVVRWRAGSPYLSPSPYSSRYVVDVIPLFMIAIVLACRGMTGDRLTRVSLRTAGFVLVLGLGSTVHNLVVGDRGKVARDFADTVVASPMAEVGYFDGRVPSQVVPSFFGPFDFLSGVVPLFTERAPVIRDRDRGIGSSLLGQVKAVSLNRDSFGGPVAISKDKLDECRSGTIRFLTLTVRATSVTADYVNQVVLTGEFRAGERLFLHGSNGGVTFDITPKVTGHVVGSDSNLIVLPLFQDLDELEVRFPERNPACPESVGVASLVPDG